VEIFFLRGAEADLLATWMRYEEILPGLGERFEVEVRAALFGPLSFLNGRLFTLENSGDCWRPGKGRVGNRQPDSLHGCYFR
jgi:hypothetical protein